MLRNYITFVFRNLKRNPGYLSINLLGLALGIATVLLIALYVQHELSYDQYHEKKDRIYRMVSYSGFAEKSWGGYVSGDPIPEMRASYTDVEDAAKYMTCGSDNVTLGNTRYEDISMLCGESNLFNIFSFDVIAGDRNAMLDAPNTVVITRSLSERLFGNENPIGKTIPIHFGYSAEDATEFEITGYMEDVPTNSHFRFDLMISYESLRSTTRCMDCGQVMYAMLHEGANPDSVASRALTHVQEIDGRNYVEDLQLEPLTDVYFSDIVASPQGDMRYVMIMAAIAGLILLIGCANYMNLATARFSQRSKEIGVRKVLGAHRFELMKQFYLETIILTLLSLPLAIVLLAVGIPYFNTVANTDVAIQWFGDLTLYMSILGLLVVIGIIAGSYPALFLSSFKPSEVIKGTLKPSLSAAGIRKGLVVFQFMIALVMIVVTGVIMQQLFYLQDKNLGFDTDQVVVATMGDPSFMNQYTAVQQEFQKIASIKHVSAASGVPMRRGGAHFIHQVDDRQIEFVTPTIDHETIHALDIPLLAGRNISETISKGRREALMTLTGVTELGLETPDEVIGQTIGMYEIVGVVEDFHIKPLHEEIQPVILSQNNWGQANSFIIKIEGGTIRDTFDDLQAAWDDLGTNGPLEITFVEDQINQIYEKEQNTAKIIGFFAFMSIFVGCLGLFGLATFMTERRIKEIGIRKVLGASVGNILALLSKDFGKLVLLASLIAAPIAYIIANKWLANFSYRIDIGASIFLISGLVVLLIALFSTGIRSLQAAIKNPADTLRS